MASTPKVLDVCARLWDLYPPHLAGTEQHLESTAALGAVPSWHTDAGKGRFKGTGALPGHQSA